MEEEIKEVLDNFEKYEARYILHNETQFIITHREIQILLDYITNLQEENEKLKELCNKYEEEHSTAFKLWTMKMEEMPCYEEFMNYKSRNEKAIEYCNYNDESLYTFEPDYDYEENMIDNYEPSNFREDLLNILNGGDKE